MKNLIKSPFYTIADNKLLYLNKYEICKLPLEEDIREMILINEGVLLYKKELKKFWKKILVIEPHADDYALSALAYSMNNDTIVANIFSKTNIDSFTWNNYINININEYERLRLEESELSINKLLDKRFVSLKEESTRINKKELSFVKNNILKFIRDILKSNPDIDTIMIPMGIGNHPDHIIVHDTIMKELGTNSKYTIIFYPEYPYARCRVNYDSRMEELKKIYNIKPIVVDVEDKLDILTDAVSAYRSQFDDINRIQMLAIIREDCRAIAQEFNKENLSFVYYEVEKR